MDDTDSRDSSISSSSSMGVAASLPSSKPKPFSQGQLVHDINLSKESFEILASHLHEYGILSLETKTTFYHDRDDMLICFFTMEDNFVYCNNIQDLLSKMGLIQ